jgi:hypothetical protein
MCAPACNDRFRRTHDGDRSAAVSGAAVMIPPDPFNALVVTNFAYHFGSPDGKVPRTEWGIITSAVPESPLDNNVLRDISETLNR